MTSAHSSHLWTWAGRERKLDAGWHAVQVCPDSAKVRLNMGILERRYGRWADSLRHFERAREIEPGCGPGIASRRALAVVQQTVKLARDETCRLISVTRRFCFRDALTWHWGTAL